MRLPCSSGEFIAKHEVKNIAPKGRLHSMNMKRMNRFSSSTVKLFGVVKDFCYFASKRPGMLHDKFIIDDKSIIRSLITAPCYLYACSQRARYLNQVELFCLVWKEGGWFSFF